MRKVSVPVDMSSEQKVILGIVSMRQLIYMVVGGTIIYSFVPLVWGATAGLPIGLRIALCVIVSLPLLVIIVPLAFIRNRRYGMFYDYYLLVRLGGKTQVGTWAKGRKAKDWMEGL